MSERKGSENLRPLNTLAKEAQRKIQSQGGKACAQKKRERKAFKELLHIALMEKNPSLDMTNAEAIVAGIIAAAAAGDTKAFVAIRDTLGEKPVETVKTELDGGIAFSWKKSE